MIHEFRRVWPALLVVAVSAAVFRGPTLLSVFWRLTIAGLAFLAAQCMWKAAFGHLDLERHMTEFLDLVSKARGAKTGMEAAIAHAIIVSGILIFRAALYLAIILGVLANIGGA